MQEKENKEEQKKEYQVEIDPETSSNNRAYANQDITLTDTASGKQTRIILIY